MTPSNRPTFVIDRCLGKAVKNALLEAGAQVEHLDDHFSQDAKDEEWLPRVSEWGWVVLSKDEKIRTKALEVRAIARAGARVFILASGNLNRHQMASLFVEALPKLEKFNQGNPAPFIVKLYKDGRIKTWHNRTKLLKLVKRDQPLGLL